MGVPRSVLGYLLLISFSIIRTEGYVLQGEEQLGYNVWDDEELNPQAEAEKILSILCENYRSSIKTEQIIDCSNYQFAENDLLIDDSNHVISKREANDTDLLEEGSGDGDAGLDDVAEEKPLETNSTTNLEEEARKNDEEIDVNVENSNEEEKPVVDDKLTTKTAGYSPSTIIDVVPYLGTNEKEEKSVNKTDDTPIIAANDGSQPENNENEEKLATTTTPAASNTPATVLPPAPVPEPAESDKKDAAPTTTTPASVADSDQKEAAVDGKDSDKEAAPQVPAETTEQSKQPETVDDKQSNNAVIFKEPKEVAPVIVEGSDSEKHLASKLNDTELPTAGESNKNVSKAGKDTTVLIVLFVVVIVIGAAAFTHNFIKKRKQKTSENSELVNGIRRSLQNLTSGNGKNSNDVEQGTEMKPLMKNNSPIVTKEYSDKKKEVEA